MIKKMDIDIRKEIEDFKRLDRFDWLIVLAMVIMFSPTFYRLATLGWKSADYTHAYFIFPITLWLIFRKRQELVKTEEVNKVGFIIIIVASFLYLFSSLNEFMFLEAFSFVVMMYAVFKLKLTEDSFKKILFPLAYLLFLIPPPGLAIDMATLPLKKISTYGSYGLLKLFHLPVEVYGVILKVKDHELFISDACSGFRSIVTLLALGAVYAYFQDISLKKKWIIFLSVIPLGILGNILRITLTGIISYFVGMKYAEGFFHDFSGAVLFIFTTFGLIGLTELITKKTHEN
ncbi:exosortase/archaeosortase family protein [Candidatus Desantisbacteria bacterium]|nr:exosortase/archaeosortase family protein [Candidatus Desantisbacteria bacterium]